MQDKDLITDTEGTHHLPSGMEHTRHSHTAFAETEEGWKQGWHAAHASRPEQTWVQNPNAEQYGAVGWGQCSLFRQEPNSSGKFDLQQGAGLEEPNRERGDW